MPTGIKIEFRSERMYDAEIKEIEDFLRMKGAMMNSDSDIKVEYNQQADAQDGGYIDTITHEFQNRPTQYKKRTDGQEWRTINGKTTQFKFNKEVKK